MKKNYMINVLLATIDFLLDIIKRSPSGDSYLSLPQFSKLDVTCDVGFLLDGLKALEAIFNDYLEDGE